MFKYFFLFSSFVFSQKFIVLENETQDLIYSVNYNVYYNNEKILEKITFNDKANELLLGVKYDSIIFKHKYFYDKTILKGEFNQIVYLDRLPFQLKELTVAPKYKDDNILLGEKNSFIKRRSAPISKEYTKLVKFKNIYNEKINIYKFQFYAEKVNYKTKIKIVFLKIKTADSKNDAYLLDKIVFQSDSEFLNVGDKGLIEIDLEKYSLNLEKEEEICVTILLEEYYDERNNVVFPNLKDLTSIKFILSQKTNYFDKYLSSTYHDFTNEFFNINEKIKHDFAFQFFRKPHKTVLVAPAFFLEVGKN